MVLPPQNPNLKPLFKLPVVSYDLIEVKAVSFFLDQYFLQGNG